MTTTITEVNIMTTSLLLGLGIGILVFMVFSIPQRSRLSGEPAEWLFEHFFGKLYKAFFGPSTDPVKINKSLGLEYDKFMIDCAVIGKIPDFEVMAMQRIIGVFSFFFSIPLSLILHSYIPIIVGICMFLGLCSLPIRSVHSAAQRKKQRMLAEMPRFVDLLLSALEINLPIETAILTTADNVPCLLSNELKATFAETQIGAKSWQEALESVARKYEIDQLSDFVLNIITAYNKGVSITEAVAREAYNVRQNSLLMAKEKTAKMTSGILFPLLIFKILPLLVIMLVPIMIQALAFYGS